MLKNQQPIEKLVNNSHLEVHSVFLTIQGEGYFSGRVATFIRLSGCNLQCPLCDTDYTSTRDILPIHKVVEKILSKVSCLIVITGGEPFRQSHAVGLLIKRLLELEYSVVVETNGTLPPPDFIEFQTKYRSRPSAYISCSPKTAKLNPAIIEKVFYYKYVVSADAYESESGFPINVLGRIGYYIARPPEGFNGNIYVQPADEKHPTRNRKNLEVAKHSCFTFDHVLNLQIHKIIGVE